MYFNLLLSIDKKYFIYNFGYIKFNNINEKFNYLIIILIYLLLNVCCSFIIRKIRKHEKISI
jgi:hypothetical protein